MEGILKFKLPEEEDDYQVAVNAKEFYFVLYDLDQFLEGELKYGQYKEAIEMVRKRMYNLLETYGINLDMLP